MKSFLLTTLIIFGCLAFVQSVFAQQIPTTTLVKIVRAEDERRWDSTLENLLKNGDAKIRARAALAAGRIGDEKSVPALVNLLKDDSDEVQTTAAFALGETESAQAIPAIVETLKDRKNSVAVRARALEAAGKIAAANPKDANFKMLGEVILQTLNFENERRSASDDEIILAGLTAVLRARPADADKVTANFLHYSNPRIRADALNTLARLRAKNVNAESRELLEKDSDPVVRANAARMLGVGEDKSAVDLLLNAATKYFDSRVRVSAIRALGNLKDASVADKLLFHYPSFSTDSMNGTGCEVQASNKLKNNPLALLECDFDLKSEMLEIATTLGNLLPNTNNQNAVSFLTKFRVYDNYQSPETEIAYARIAPSEYLKNYRNSKQKTNWRTTSALAQGLGEIANSTDENLKAQARTTLLNYFTELVENVPSSQADEMNKAVPDLLTALAAFKPDNLDVLLREMITTKDIQIRATAAGILADQPATKENVVALKSAFVKSLLTDKHENDAQLAMLDALYKLDKKLSVGIFLTALDAPDYLVRKKAFEILKDDELQKDFPGIRLSLENARAQKKNQVLPYAPFTGTKLGQTLNYNADYIRAVSRKNGTVKAILTTTKGSFTINFFPEDAPLTVDNFVKLARVGYFNGIEVHRVVSNFVMQDGDPRGDGNGGPGWEIRDEINMIPYNRGAVGMALSGKDTGGSQWFVTHSPQPHLDGGYTVFGQVNETDMKIVDNIVRGDKILSVKIVENNLPQKFTKRRKN